MKSILLYFLLLITLMSCNSQTLDLSTIDFDKSANNYPLEKLKTYRKEEQKGHYEVIHDKDGATLALKDQGERVTNYIFMNKATTKQLSYGGIALDPITGVEISVYENKFAYMHLTVDFKSRFKLFDLLKDKLGKPTMMVNNSILLKNIDLEMQKLFFAKLPIDTKIDEDNNHFLFPERLLWVTKNVFYKLELNPSGNSIESTLTIISKEAFKDRIIIDYHNPDKDPFLSKYLKQ